MNVQEFTNEEAVDGGPFCNQIQSNSPTTKKDSLGLRFETSEKYALFNLAEFLHEETIPLAILSRKLDGYTENPAHLIQILRFSSFGQKKAKGTVLFPLHIYLSISCKTKFQYRILFSPNFTSQN